MRYLGNGGVFSCIYCKPISINQRMKLKPHIDMSYSIFRASLPLKQRRRSKTSGEFHRDGVGHVHVSTDTLAYIKDKQWPSRGNITCMNKAKPEQHTLQYFVPYSVRISAGVLEYLALAALLNCRPNSACGVRTLYPVIGAVVVLSWTLDAVVGCGAAKNSRRP